jgi:hypothetical protein
VTNWKQADWMSGGGRAHANHLYRRFVLFIRERKYASARYFNHCLPDGYLGGDGCDSKISFGNYSKSWSGCKIGIANNVFWGKSGILGLPAAGFDIDAIATRITKSTTSVAAAVNAFEREIVPRLTDVVNGLKRGSYDSYMKTREGKAALQIVFISIEDGISNICAQLHRYVR